MNVSINYSFKIQLQIIVPVPNVKSKVMETCLSVSSDLKYYLFLRIFPLWFTLQILVTKEQIKISKGVNLNNKTNTVFLPWKY